MQHNCSLRDYSIHFKSILIYSALKVMWFGNGMQMLLCQQSIFCFHLVSEPIWWDIKPIEPPLEITSKDEIRGLFWGQAQPQGPPGHPPPQPSPQEALGHGLKESILYVQTALSWVMREGSYGNWISCSHQRIKPSLFSITKCLYSGMFRPTVSIYKPTRTLPASRQLRPFTQTTKFRIENVTRFCSNSLTTS